MTLAEFYTNVENTPSFIKWVDEAVEIEARGNVKKMRRDALVNTKDGKNIVGIWFIDNDGDVAWQTTNTLEPKENTTQKKQAALEAYLSAQFNAYFINRADLDNNWAEADVYTVKSGVLEKSVVLVFKRGNNPISHLVVN